MKLEARPDPLEDTRPMPTPTPTPMPQVERDPNTDVKDRVLLPILLPFGSLALIVVLVAAFSRMLLASPKDIATSAALAAGAGIMLVASLLVARPIANGHLRSLMLLGAIGLIGGGAYAAAQGYAPLHGEEAAHGSGGEGAAAAATELDIDALDIDWSVKQVSLPAGPVHVNLTNAGAIEHTLVIDGISGFKLAVEATGDTDSGTVELAPGTYTFFCDVPGHRGAGMEGTLTAQ